MQALDAVSGRIRSSCNSGANSAPTQTTACRFRAVVSPTGPGVAALERACLLLAVVAAAPTLAEADVRPLDSAAENATVDE
jgi:hypothetical protein